MKLAVMASGTGSILESILLQGVLVELVVADRPCKAIDIASVMGSPTVIVDRRSFGYKPWAAENWEREGFTRAIRRELDEHGIELVAMAGFMTILHPSFFDEFDGWILNIHPSMLPRFKGEHAVRDALQAGVPVTGTTIHISTEELDDHRYIVTQQAVPVHDDDTEDTLHERIKKVERELYPQVLRDILTGQINLKAIKEQS
jgi:formyltetrahydrofolate-dependent phosphoribosylglycinamide formyltransferase